MKQGTDTIPGVKSNQEEPRLFHLAQLNVGHVRHPVEHPLMEEFTENLDRINSLAESSPGFVWRFQTASGNATDAIHPWSDDAFLIVNLSVWQSPKHLKEFVYNTEHFGFYQRRAEWFERAVKPHSVLWWIPAGHTPTLEEAAERLEHYRTHGATAYAFWFGKLFPADEAINQPAAP
jgi:hypothetical protein